jgi:hypothetical protein
MTVMALIFRIVLGIHIIAGAAALLVFWIPLVTRKGGRTHRGAGWAYVTAAAIVAMTGIASAGWLMFHDPRPHAWRAGIFLVYVGLFAAESALLGARALRPQTACKTRSISSPRSCSSPVESPSWLSASPRRSCFSSCSPRSA